MGRAMPTHHFCTPFRRKDMEHSVQNRVEKRRFLGTFWYFLDPGSMQRHGTMRSKPCSKSSFFGYFFVVYRHDFAAKTLLTQPKPYSKSSFLYHILNAVYHQRQSLHTSKPCLKSNVFRRFWYGLQPSLVNCSKVDE